jgi:thermitase
MLRVLTLAAVLLLPAVGMASPQSRTLAHTDGVLAPVVTHAAGSALASVDDPLYGQQWGFNATDTPTAWQDGRRMSPVIVAVVDTGVDAAHPDLAGKVLPGWNMISNSPDTSDDNGHGTAVAGIIAAVTGNATGVASYCWRCQILPVKVLDSHGAGSLPMVAAGVRWAVDHGARVINLSLGAIYDDGGLRDAITYAQSRGAVVVAAAGNLGTTRPEYPAADPGVISVAGSDQNGALFTWSENGSWVQLAAPGSNLTTASSGGYNGFTGTSAATPVVSGIAAMALSAVPRATGAEVVTALQQGARPTAGVQYGVVDAAHTVDALLAEAHPTSTARLGSAAHHQMDAPHSYPSIS